MGEKIRKNSWILLFGKKSYIVKAKGEFHCEFGKINLEKIVGREYGTEIKSHLGEKFMVVKPTIIDLMKKVKRGPQVILPKDAALILAKTGVNRNSVVLDAGSGSGFLAIFLSNYVKKVYTYEKRKEFYKIVSENLKLLGIRNVVVKNKDVLKGFDEKEADLITLDLENPEKIIPIAKRSLKISGWLAVFCPYAEEVGKVVKTMEKDFVNIEVFENLQREWEVSFDKRGKSHLRAKPYMTFTGFIVFGRRVK